MADLETQNQLAAGLRYAGASAGTLFAILGAMSLITPDQMHDLSVQIHVLNDSILTAYGALIKMWVILGPAAVIVAGYFGVKSSSVQAIGQKLLAIAKNGASSENAKQALIAATIELPSVQTIVTDKKTADAAPSESVVAAEAVKVVQAK